MHLKLFLTTTTFSGCWTTSCHKRLSTTTLPFGVGIDENELRSAQVTNKRYPFNTGKNNKSKGLNHHSFERWGIGAGWGAMIFPPALKSEINWLKNNNASLEINHILKCINMGTFDVNYKIQLPTAFTNGANLRHRGKITIYTTEIQAKNSEKGTNHGQHIL